MVLSVRNLQAKIYIDESTKTFKTRFLDPDVTSVALGKIIKYAIPAELSSLHHIYDHYVVASMQIIDVLILYKNFDRQTSRNFLNFIVSLSFSS